MTTVLMAVMVAGTLTTSAYGADRASDLSGRRLSAAVIDAPSSSLSAITADDDFPGVAIPVSPIAGSLDVDYDELDIYSINVMAGQTISASLTSPYGADFDLWLVNRDAFGDLVWLEVAESETSPDVLQYMATETKVHYLIASAYDGWGSYTLSYSLTPPDYTAPTVSCVVEPTYILNAAIPVSASDVGSAVKYVYYQVDGGEVIRVAGNSTTVNSSALGTHSLTVWAEDVAGNLSTKATSSFQIVSDEYLPGIPMVGSSLVSSVSAELDSHDFYSVNLAAGEVIEVNLAGPEAADFDLSLWAPSGSEPVTSSESLSSTETLSYRASQAGVYSVKVLAKSGAGDYTLSYSTRKSATSVIATRSTANPAYSASFVLRGSLIREDGAPIPGAAVVFERQAGASWIAVGTALTDAQGTAAVSTVPYNKAKTVYRARYAGDQGNVGSVSSAVVVIPQVYVSNPSAPSTMYRRRAAVVSGYLKSRHTAGTYPVKVQAWAWNKTKGQWVSMGIRNAKASNYSSYTKYTVTFTPSGAATKWRFRALAIADSQHAATWSSGYKYVTVK